MTTTEPIIDAAAINPGAWDTDPEYSEGTITNVSAMFGQGWLITVEGKQAFLGKRPHAVLLVRSALEKRDPVVGETARLYGPDRHRVRGIIIGARVYHYMTAAEAEAAQEVKRIKMRDERQAILDKERAVRDARWRLLPEPLQERARGFLRRGGEAWRRDVEAYELETCEVVALIAAMFAGSDFEAFSDFDNLTTEAQMERVTGKPTHPLGGQGFQVAVALAGMLVSGTGALLPLVHGAGCSRGIGCVAGHCYGPSSEYDQATVEAAIERAGRASLERHGCSMEPDTAEALREMVRDVNVAEDGSLGALNPPGSGKSVEEIHVSAADLRAFLEKHAGATA